MDLYQGRHDGSTSKTTECDISITYIFHAPDDEVFAKSGEEESAKVLISVLALMQSVAMPLLWHG